MEALRLRMINVAHVLSPFIRCKIVSGFSVPTLDGSTEDCVENCTVDSEGRDSIYPLCLLLAIVAPYMLHKSQTLPGKSFCSSLRKWISPYFGPSLAKVIQPTITYMAFDHYTLLLCSIFNNLQHLPLCLSIPYLRAFKHKVYQLLFFFRVKVSYWPRLSSLLHPSSSSVLQGCFWDTRLEG